MILSKAPFTNQNCFHCRTNWPIITKKHDDIAVEFVNRMTRDQCAPGIIWNYSADNKSIVSVTVTANGNRCSTPVPVTFPVPVAAPAGARTEQVGSDPLTVWVPLNGQPVTINLSRGIAI